MEKLKNYFEQNKQRYLDELFELIRIPSVSSDPKRKNEMIQTAEMVRKYLLAAGVEKAEVYETDGHPVVYGEKIIDSDLPTVMVYGHYDVQPADPLELWHSEPYEPVIRKTDIHPEGAIFARGACDDKGQLFMHVKAFEAMNNHDALPCNIKFMIEGEEEIGSPSLAKFCEQNKELLGSDVILVSDTSIINKETPSITTGLRGLSYVEVEVTGPNKDLHSGVYGGGVANPANILAKMITGLMDENNRITINGFYDDVIEVSEDERKAMNKAPFDLEAYKKALDIDEVDGEAGYTTLERTSIRPTLDVNGIWGGFTGEGTKTVLPSRAFAKISMRLVPDQDPEKIASLFEKHFKSIAPRSVKVKVKYLHGGFSSVTPVDTPEYKAAAMAMQKTFGKEVIPVRSGGSIPIIALFEKVLGVKSVLMGFGLDSDDIHSPNENYGLFNFYRGIETIPYFYQYYTELKS
jgi:acetylornithine deacetylase/succinyl-diaminopimelate desuccinylase-like protein